MLWLSMRLRTLRFSRLHNLLRKKAPSNPPQHPPNRNPRNAAFPAVAFTFLKIGAKVADYASSFAPLKCSPWVKMDILWPFTPKNARLAAGAKRTALILPSL